MGNIRKLPFLSGCAAAVLAGIISFAAGADNQTIYIRMAVMMFLLYDRSPCKENGRKHPERT